MLGKYFTEFVYYNWFPSTVYSYIFVMCILAPVLRYMQVAGFTLVGKAGVALFLWMAVIKEI